MLAPGYFRHKELFNALLQVQQGQLYQPPRKPIFRVSELPFCPLLHIIDKIKYDPKQYEPIDFESGFYFNMGHAVHNLWQSVATHKLANSLIGDWQCTRVLQEKTGATSTKLIKCNRVIPFTTYRKAIKFPCPHQQECAKNQVYQELTIAWGGLTGHTDFLWIDKRKRFHLVDFKTTGNFLFENPERAMGMGYYPSVKYFIQIMSYAVMLERKYKIKIDSVSIAYVSRDKAIHRNTKYKRALHLFSRKLTNGARQRCIKDIRRYHRKYVVARNWLDASPKQRSHLTKHLYAIRPCHSHKDYHNKMSPAFLSNAPCEHHVNGECYNDDMLIRLRKLENK